MTRTTYRLDPPWPSPPLNHNQRLKWREKAKIVAEIRRDVGWLAKIAKIPPAEHITVQLVYLPGSERKRDAMNLTATSKPAIDGIVDAGIVVDDNDAHVTELTPMILPPSEDGPRCWLTVEITNRKAP